MVLNRWKINNKIQKKTFPSFSDNPFLKNNAFLYDFLCLQRSYNTFIGNKR